MANRTSQRNQIRNMVARNQRDLTTMHERIIRVMEVYVESKNDYHAAYIGQLISGINMLRKAHDKVYNIL